MTKACEIPDSEQTSGSDAPSTGDAPGWADNQGINLTQKFVMTVSSQSLRSFGGRVVQEQDGGGGVDECYFPGSAVPQVTSIPSPPGIWVVGTDNTFGWDQIGYFPDLVAYIRDNRPSGSTWPCRVALKQNMAINCARQNGQASYFTYGSQNTLQVSIDKSSETVTRGNATFTRNK
jgi:hypothetical protein